VLHDDATAATAGAGAKRVKRAAVSVAPLLHLQWCIAVRADRRRLLLLVRACDQVMTALLAAAWPLLSQTARLLWLRACCAVAEGADVPLSHAVSYTSRRCPPDVCVGAVLGDALHRVAVLGGREGVARSLGSTYGGAVARFLGGGCRGVECRVIDTPGGRSSIFGAGVSVDGSTLLVSEADAWGGPHAIHVLTIADVPRRRVVGSKGDGPLQFIYPCQVYVAPDGFVFVADSGNHRVQVLTPTLDFHGFVGVGELSGPRGVCANADVVVVTEAGFNAPHRISVFSRCDGALVRRFAAYGSGDGELHWPRGLCFMSNDRHVAVADHDNSRASVFSVDGEFIRHVGGGHLKSPYGVACSAFDELVVADSGNSRVVVFSGSGELMKTVGRGDFIGVAVHGSTLFAQDRNSGRCVVFE
jgi:hypothetical protein